MRTNTEINKKANDDEIDLRQLFLNIRRKWHYFLISFLVFVGGGFLYIKFTLPVYEAKSSVLIKDSKDKSRNIEDFLAGDLFGNSKNVSTEIGILQSRSVLEETITKLNLGVSYFGSTSFFKYPVYKTTPFIVKPEKISDGVYDQPFELTILDSTKFTLEISIDEKGLSNYSYKGTHHFGEEIKTPVWSLSVLRNDEMFPLKTEDEYTFVVNSMNKMIANYTEKMKIDALNKDATIIVISIQDNLKDRAVDFLNALGKAYIDRDVRDKSSVAGLTLQFVDEQLEQISKTLGTIEQNLQKFKEEKGTVDLGEEAKSYLERLNTIDTDRAKAEIELKTLDYLYDYVTQNKDLAQLAPSAIGTPDPLLINLITELQQLASKRNSLKYGSSNESPAVRVIDEQIADAKNKLIENIQNIRERSKVNLVGLGKQLTMYEGQIHKVPLIERELLGIQRNFSVNENIYLYLLQKKAETGIAKATAVSDNKVLDEANVNDKPVIPNTKAVLIIIVMLALVFPVIIILLQGFINNTISSREDIEKMTKVPIIGVVGHLSTGERLVVANKPKSSIAEAFRSIRANLMYFGLADAHKVVLITSSVGGEGKSFSTLNLASVLALQNHRVIIVGMDLRKPQLSKDLGLENNVGVSNYLIGKATLKEVIQHTSVENLDVIGSGPIPPNPAELLAKKETQHLIEELRNNYDYVIIDTPPVGIVSDAMMLMNYADINIFILRENYSRRDYIKTINGYQMQGSIKNLCILLNDAGVHHRYGYGYGYGYSYGYGYGYYDEEHKKKKLFSRLRKSKA